MPARITTLCDEIVDYLNSQSYSQSFTAQRLNLPIMELEATSGLLVTVFPVEYQLTAESRSVWQWRLVVSIAIQKVITASDRTAEEDDLLLLAEEIEESLQDVDMGSFGMLELSGDAGGRPLFNADHLHIAGQFTAIVQVTYLGI